MKTKLIGGLKERNDLDLFPQSIETSKPSCFQVKISEQEALLESSIQHHHAVASNIEVVLHKNESDEEIARHDSFSGATPRIQKSPSSSFDSSGISGLLPTICPAILETISSPITGSKKDHYTAGYDGEDGNSSSGDVSNAGLPFDEFTRLDDLSAANTCLEYQSLDSDMMLAQIYMELPLLEDDETGNFHDGESIQEAPMTSGDPYLAIQHMKPSDHDAGIIYNSGDLDEVVGSDPHLFIRNVPDLSELAPSLWPTLLPEETKRRNLVTLVLDLDETLVHSTLEYCDDADFAFSIDFNMKEHHIHVRLRPYLRIFLERVAQMFEIILFTASDSIYADKVLYRLDPDYKLISRRVYRESCTFTDGSYVKDLTVLGLDLAKVAIIDNSPQVFRLQVNNGIPIESWYGDPLDCALISLLPFLETLVDVDDVRPIIAQRFNNE